MRDYVFQEGSRWLAQIIGVRNITRPFWNRWRASMLGDEVILRFLDGIKSLDDWLPASLRLVAELEKKYADDENRLSPDEKIARLRQLSFLCNMGQWGSVTVNDDRRSLYRRSRDYYVQAETLAQGGLYRRAGFEFKGKTYWANIHLPPGAAPPFPGVLILHGMDDVKEEHLMTELGAQRAGVAVCSIDGPGQGESLILDGTLWSDDFADFALSVIEKLAVSHSFDPNHMGLVGVSWGGFWIYKVAARAPALRGIFDLGGPTRWADWYRDIPYFLKLRYCVILDANTEADIAAHEPYFTFADELQHIRCKVRIVHGRCDPVVAIGDKEKQVETLRKNGTDVTMRVFPKGDHCCTGEADEVRQDAETFFRDVLFNEAKAPPSYSSAPGPS